MGLGATAEAVAAGAGPAGSAWPASKRATGRVSRSAALGAAGDEGARAGPHAARVRQRAVRVERVIGGMVPGSRLQRRRDDHLVLCSIPSISPKRLLQRGGPGRGPVGERRPVCLLALMRGSKCLCLIRASRMATAVTLPSMMRPSRFWPPFTPCSVLDPLRFDPDVSSDPVEPLLLDKAAADDSLGFLRPSDPRRSAGRPFHCDWKQLSREQFSFGDCLGWQGVNMRFRRCDC